MSTNGISMSSETGRTAVPAGTPLQMRILVQDDISVNCQQIAANIFIRCRCQQKVTGAVLVPQLLGGCLEEDVSVSKSAHL